jgi:hypothetical protein
MREGTTMDGWMVHGLYIFFHWILVPLLMGTKNGRTHSETEDSAMEWNSPLPQVAAYYGLERGLRIQ